MKVLALLGSPRKNGNTARVLSWVEDKLKRDGHQVERLDVAALGLEGCAGCHLCQKSAPDELVCSRRDSGLEVFRKMIAADAIIYASPLYWFDFTAQIKSLIDRHLCLIRGGADNPATHYSQLEGKRLALLVTAYDQAGEGNSDLLSEMFRRMAAFCKAPVTAELVVPYCREPKDLGPMQKDSAERFAAELVA